MPLPSNGIDQIMKKILLKGTPASIGIASGPVKIITYPFDFSEFEEGYILVTEMTTPLFLPVMRKAIAIVTDIGGLLCHAAIVSRELKIPCVVNTKDGTTVLKDNQVVVVNAIKGEIYESK